MNQPQLHKWKITASLVFAALLMFASSASATLTITTTNQNPGGTFTPTWTVATSLIAGLSPSTSAGSFTLEGSGGISKLTDGAIGPVGSGLALFATAGNNGSAGHILIYTLPVAANGYNVTNITVYSGWNDNGRDAQAYTVSYSTVANPANFIFLGYVNYNPSIGGGRPSANQVMLADSAGAPIAANVAAVKFDFQFPNVENGYVGYSEITVQGTAAATVVSPVVSITTSNQSNPTTFTPSWPVESPSLIAGLAPTTATGNFTQEGSAGTSVLTDGALGASGNVAGFATCGNSGGNTLIYTLTNVVNGSDVTNIVVYSGWGNANRDGQYYTLSYSTIAAPTSYIPITTVLYNPNGVSGASANRVSIAMDNGSVLGTGVANIKFSFSAPPGAGGFDNAYSGISEIIVQGGDTATPPPPPSPYLTDNTLPSYAETVVGDQVIFTAAYSNSPPANVQWVFISGGATNSIPGATSPTLTLNNVQLTNTGSYLLKAVNATNGAAAPSYSTAAPLVVGSIPAAVNGVIVNYAGQSGLGSSGNSTNFYPYWTENTNNDLILGATIGAGTLAAGPGNFGLGASSAGDPTILTDGSFGYFNYWPNVGSSVSLISCGSGGAGQYVTYTLPMASATGYDLTNITVYGGWGDNGRNEQKYEILYSTIAAPATFNHLVTVDYNPNNPGNSQSATRTSLIGSGSAMAHNVAAVQVNFFFQGAAPKNNWEGYSEIVIAGTNSAAIPVLTQDINPRTAEDVVGSQLILTASFNGATSYQWQKNGTNLLGATSPTLTLNNLQLTDTATNGGYRLVAFNPSGAANSVGCSVVIDPAPAATNNVVTSFAYQTSPAGSFSPTWDTTSLGLSLISGATPTSYGTGIFDDPDGNPVSFHLAGGLPVLTDGDYGTIINGGAHPAFATCGPTAGEFVTYTLPATAYGYDLTNIVIAGGWNDGGRNSQYYTLSYATTSNPTLFIPLAVVANNPNLNDKSEIRATFTPAAGILASNVYAIQVDFQFPQGVPNNYSGYSQVSVFGSPSATAPPAGPVITAQNEQTNFDWVVETPNLIANQLPSSAGPGVFTLEGCNVTNLTDGVIGFGFAFGASCGGGGGSVPYVVFNSAQGWNLTNIVVYSLWHDYGRDGQFYNVSYSTLSAPSTFLPLASVSYNPFVPHDGRATGNRVAIAPAIGQTMLATNVYAVKFDFTPQGVQDFGWTGYSEIVLQGSSLAPATPPTISSATLAGGNLILKATGGTPNYSYTVLSATNLLTPLTNWTVIASGVTDGAGAISNAIPASASGNSFFRVRMP